MGGNLVKGELFLRVMDDIGSRWGANGIGMVGHDPADYSAEQWYGLGEFCKLLASVKSRLGSNNPISVYQVGLSTIKGDERWQELFDNRDPSSVFITTERQESLYKVGAVTATPLGPKHVRVDFSAEGADPLWFEFYRGQLQAVLELTGRTGVVHLLPASAESGGRTFDIKWG